MHSPCNCEQTHSLHKLHSKTFKICFKMKVLLFAMRFCLCSCVWLHVYVCLWLHVYVQSSSCVRIQHQYTIIPMVFIETIPFNSPLTFPCHSYRFPHLSKGNCNKSYCASFIRLFMFLFPSSWICLSVRVCAYACECENLCAREFIVYRTCTCICICVCLCVYICLCAHACACAFMCLLTLKRYGPVEF